MDKQRLQMLTDNICKSGFELVGFHEYRDSIKMKKIIEIQLEYGNPIQDEHCRGGAGGKPPECWGGGGGEKSYG
jgi:hypothetical protein